LNCVWHLQNKDINTLPSHRGGYRFLKKEGKDAEVTRVRKMLSPPLCPAYSIKTEFHLLFWDLGPEIIWLNILKVETTTGYC
jgi:hypothetical protein